MIFFKYSNILEYSNIFVIFLWIIFSFIFETQGVKNIIHICIRRLYLLQIIFVFVFVHQKNYSLDSGVRYHAVSITAGFWPFHFREELQLIPGFVSKWAKLFHGRFNDQKTINWVELYQFSHFFALAQRTFRPWIVSNTM